MVGGVERSSDTKDRLIEGTRQLLWDRGYVGTSPTAILRRSGVGQGSMYHHFRGKSDLVLAAERRSAELMQAQVREVFSGEGTGLQRIVAYLLLQRDVLRGCSVGRLAGDPEIVADDELRAPVRETFAVLNRCLSEAVAEAQAAGELDARLRPEETAAALAAVIQGGYALARAEQSTEPFDRAIHGALDLLGVPADDRVPVGARSS
ncbi:MULTISPECIES: TetR/AcrR family transcriptional regulator [Streptomyces]|jgi:AcrR family transcriptional regulator|uniref:TetR/AcrR family transcriptional regulator n=1 Tax=Streptomyces thermoviolaceus subsp. thermoviolaceus TaxID=66860 RepID=A0ABX0YWF1_STRTL|nr:TetR/AcrR family transcriptional regulator [Streptomyces thermoviolaceus subsp. thermoviolaceus]RSS09116.1 TetR/AcrR family transcriptional regulator [Streptomyces sp. WAC00469]GHB12558.1 TetR family transcriptional regulator [Streptomyces thermoviolaceus subsp. thermoviolaceus]